MNTLAGLWIFVVVMVVPLGVRAQPRELRETTEIPTTPATAIEIAALSGRSCLRALVRANVPFERIRWARSGIVTPVIVTGPVGGVTIRASRNRIVHETMDCQLALALVHWARFLRTRGVREVRHLSIHRPATLAELAQQPVPPRHPGALAIDVSTLILDDGTTYEVHRDFHGELDAPVCGSSARVDPRPASVFLRRLFCETARTGIFHVVLSPNFNDEHHNHFHFEITRSVSWIYVH
jgi:hypothetical protein